MHKEQYLTNNWRFSRNQIFDFFPSKRKTIFRTRQIAVASQRLVLHNSNQLHLVGGVVSGSRQNTCQVCVLTKIKPPPHRVVSPLTNKQKKTLTSQPIKRGEETGGKKNQARRRKLNRARLRKKQNKRSRERFHVRAGTLMQIGRNPILTRG